MTFVRVGGYRQLHPETNLEAATQDTTHNCSIFCLEDLVGYDASTSLQVLQVL